MLAFCMQSGAGLYVNTGGEANLNGCQVYENSATVRAPVPGLTSSAPLERFVCLLFVQWYGGGLFISGTATLTNTNVFSNEAYVRPPYTPSLQRPAGTLRGARFLHAVWRRALRRLRWHSQS